MITRDLKLLFAAIFCQGFGYGLYFYLAPIYAQQLGANPQQIGIIYTAFYLVTALVAIPGGLMADRYQLKTIIVAIWFFMIPAGFLYYIAPSWQHLIVANIFAGLSMFNSPAVSIYIARIAPAHRLKSSYTLVYSSFAAGMIISPALGGFISTAYNIRLVFLMATILFVLSAFVIFFISPARPASAFREKKIFALFKNAEFVEMLIYFTAIFFAVYISQPFLMPFVKVTRGFNLAQIGILGAISSVGATILGPATGFLADKRGSRVSMFVGLAAAFFGLFFLLSFFNFGLILIAFFLFGIIEGFYNLSGAVISGLLSDLPAGLAFGFFRTLTVGSAFIAPYLGGWLYSKRLSYPFMASGLLLLLILLMTAIVPFLRLRGRSLVNTVGRKLRQRSEKSKKAA